MSAWKINQIGKKPKLNKPILIEGLPGIGNVGKVAVDFIIDELNTTQIYEINSNSFPNSVFVNEENLVELPSVGVFYKKMPGRKHDLLFLAGDVQPIDEITSYEFSEKMLDISEDFGVHEIMTLGGIGLAEIPKKPKVYCTANSTDMIKKYQNGMMSSNLYGVVGPIVGVSGLMLGLAKQRNIPAIALLAETFGHPMYLGIKGAKEVLRVLNKSLDLNIRIEKLDEEIKDIEKEMLKRNDDTKKGTMQLLKKLKGRANEVNYIG